MPENFGGPAANENVSFHDIASQMRHGASDHFLTAH
jgi:hypothetical protein